MHMHYLLGNAAVGSSVIGSIKNSADLESGILYLWHWTGTPLAAAVAWNQEEGEDRGKGDQLDIVLGRVPFHTPKLFDTRPRKQYNL
jgi:hypothetical protein